MNLFFNIAYLALTAVFMCTYIISLVLNLIRALKMNKTIKENPQIIKAEVVEIIPNKKRVYVRVKYDSPANRTSFLDLFEFTQSEFKDQYYVGQIVNLTYGDVKKIKKMHTFPIYLEGMKIKPEAGAIATDAIMVIGGLYFFINTLVNQIISGAFSGDVPLFDNSGNNDGSLPFLWVMVSIVVYVVLLNYILERLFSISMDHNQKYLKICGIRGKAQVKTFKLGRSKDSKGNKESQMQIEYYTNTGEKIEARLNSHMYTETQEEYINILYDAKNPKNVVYLRSDEK